jgi:hypothetical protein
MTSEAPHVSSNQRFGPSIHRYIPRYRRYICDLVVMICPKIENGKAMLNSSDINDIDHITNYQIDIVCLMNIVNHHVFAIQRESMAITSL